MHSFGKQAPEGGDHQLCGIYYAVVTQNKDDEAKLGRIKVRFPWLPGSDSDQSAWAQLLVPMAGDTFGTFTLPEVEDTVAVIFMAGDINHPVVIGGIWNQVDKPPEVNENGKNDFRFIKSRSGHRLLFDDSDSAKVAVTDKTDLHLIGVGQFAEGGDSPNKLELPAPGAINGSPEKGALLASMDGNVNVWCPNGTLTIKAKDVEVTASGKMDVHAGGECKLEGGTNAKVCSAKAGKYEGSKIKIGP